MVGKQAWTNISPEGTKAEWQYEGIDFIDVFSAMTNNERFIIRIMKNSFRWDKAMNSYDYVVKLTADSANFDPACDDQIPYRSFLESYQTLFRQDIVRRVRRGHYMMNPAFLHITGEQIPYFERIWAESKRHPDAPVY